MISVEENVKKITPHLASMKAPGFLASKQIWLMWRYEQFQGEAKARKVPYYANGSKRYGIQGRPEDRQQLATFEAARAAAVKRGMSGVGFACLDADFTVIDLDGCAPNGVLDPKIESLATTTYAEYSPSGLGIHLIVKGDLQFSNVKSTATKDQFGIELFATKGYTTFTGNTLEITDMLGLSDTVAEPSLEIKELVTGRFGNDIRDVSLIEQAPLGVSREIILEGLEVLDPDVGYQDWLSVGMALHHETNGEGFDLWDQWSAKGAKYPGASVLEGHWQSFGKNPGKVLTIKTLVQMANANGARISLNAISMEEFENLGQQPDTKTTLPGESRFQPFPWYEGLDAVNLQYIIKGVLPQATLGVLFGESGSGKSFITLDMCFAIAQGLPWRGLRTKQGRVVYIVAEGAQGFRNRRLAYARHHSLSEASNAALDIIEAAPNLLLKEDAKELCKAILASGPKPSLVVVDTLAQTMAGANENASEDMGKALAHCKGIHAATGAMVLLIHHSGKDSSKGARGWSGLRAAADAELEVIRSPYGRMLRTTKQKDGADFKEWGFDLETVNLGEDQDGDVITSCVVVEVEVPVKEKKPESETTQALRNALYTISEGQRAGIEIKSVIALALASFPEEVRESKRANFYRYIRKFYEGDDAICFKEDDGTLTMFGEDE